jgi:signal transduction histidine kinase
VLKRKRDPLAMRPERPVVVAMVIVVLSFVGSLVYLQLHLKPVTQRALTVVEHTAPSIEHLSSAQTELTTLSMLISDYVGRVGDGRMSTRADIAATREQVGADIDAFRALPDVPGERALLANVDEDLARLDRVTKRALNEADENLSADARQTLHGHVQPEVLQTSMHISSLKALNARVASASAEDILRTRREAIVVSLVFGGIGLIVAIIATVLVLRLLGNRARLINEHTGILAARATELEAFAGRVAHDLRNPLGAVALRVLSASRREPDPKLREDLDKVARGLDRMNGIINGLLEFARAGALPTPGAWADLSEVLDEVLVDLRPAAVEEGAEILVDAFPPTRLSCTPSALNSVLSNLLGNAVKYIAEAQRMPRQILVHVKPHDANICIEIEDNGPGLPPGTEERVFEPFLRVGSSARPGIGLGLATVKKIVEAYRGRVGVTSKQGRGSTFWVELPSAPPPGGLPVPPPSRGPTRPRASA